MPCLVTLEETVSCDNISGCVIILLTMSLQPLYIELAICMKSEPFYPLKGLAKAEVEVV